jgi:outer membrane protein TolC
MKNRSTLKERLFYHSLKLKSNHFNKVILMGKPNCRSFSCQVLGCFLLILTFSVSAKAQELSEHINTAIQNNAGLKSKYHQYQSALQRLPQAGALPDPELNVGFFLRPMERYMGNQVADFSLMQMFPWFGTLEASRNEAAAMAKMKFEEFRAAQNELVYNVTVSWHELYRLEQEKKYLLENQQILETFEAISMSRFKSGGEIQSNLRPKSPINTDKGVQSASGSGGMNMGGAKSSGSSSNPMQQMVGNMQQSSSMGSGSGMVDVLRVQIQLKQNQNNLLQMEHLIKTEKTRFNSLLNQNILTEIILPDIIQKSLPPLDLTAVLDSILHKNPMLKMAENEINALEAMENMRRRMGYPMLGLGANYMVFNERQDSESHMNGMNMLMPMVSVTLPIYRKKYSSLTKETAWMKASVEEERQQIKNDLLLTFTEIAEDLKHQEHNLELFNHLIVLSEQALNILLTQYQSGGTEFEEVLRMQQELLQYKQEKLNATVKYNIALAKFEMLN